MALITISGYPSSGKTHRALQLKTFLESKLSEPDYISAGGRKFKVVIVSDDSVGIKKQDYDNARTEKPARQTLFTTLQRLMAPDTLLIIDSLNYIKGFRYQMYCAAREMKVRVSTVYVVATAEKCREWNKERREKTEKSYSDETFENLLMRYEEPSSMVRWDSPLFTVPWIDEDIPGEDIWKAITEGVIKPPNAGTQAVAKAPTDALRTLETITTSMVSSIMSEQSLSSSSSSITIYLPSAPDVKVHLKLPPRNITLSELQRIKRQFVTVHKKAITLGTTEKGAVDWSEESVARKFKDYVEENLKP
ncbi:chromatin associated protein KTI12 [Abortiporus biennis]|nr:chromatin associated protein KTI12 [Abortiporus biennis]